MSIVRANTYRHHERDRTRQTPDERVVEREPAEVRVPVALGVQSHRQTRDEGRHAPANQVVEAHGAVVDVAQLAQHAVDMQPLQEEPGEDAEPQKVLQDGYQRTQELQQAFNNHSGFRRKYYQYVFWSSIHNIYGAQNQS